MAGGTLRYWAAAKAAAGCAEEPYDADTLIGALSAARDRHNAHFSAVLDRCSFLVDGAPVGRREHGSVVLAEGGVVEVLPPFAGGSEEATPARVTSSGLVAGVVAAAVVVVVAGCALAGRPALVVAVLLAQLGLVAWWPAAVAAPARLGAALIAGAAAVAADIVVYRPRAEALGAVCGVIALAFVASLGHQLARRGRQRVTESMAATMTAVVLVAALAELVALRAARGGREAVVAGLLAAAAALLVGRLVDAVRDRPALVAGVARGWPGLLAAVLAGTVAGAAYGAAAPPLQALSGGGIGLAAATLAAAADLGVVLGTGRGGATGRRRALAALGVLLPMTAAAPPTYLLGRLLLG